MGDRTTCSLRLFGGPITEEQTGRLKEALKDAFPSEIDKESAIFFEVNYGNIDNELSTVLVDMGLSYCWSWDSGGSYGPGIKIYDAASATATQFYTIEGEIALTLTTIITNPGRVQEAIDWRAKIDAWKPFPFPEIDL